MPQKFQNKYRIASARLQSWDYGKNGAYFITICTKNRFHYFGKVINEEMVFTEIGNQAMQFWADIPKYFPYIELGYFIVMPNHVHGILIIEKNENDILFDNKILTEKKGGFSGSKNPMLNNNISRVTRWFKGRCSFEIRKTISDFGWHERFYDVIIRDSNRFEVIQHYIENNPKMWQKDKFQKNSPST